MPLLIGLVETAAWEIPQILELTEMQALGLHKQLGENIHNVGLYPHNNGGNPSFHQAERTFGKVHLTKFQENTKHTGALRRVNKLALDVCNGKESVSYIVSEQVHDKLMEKKWHGQVNILSQNRRKVHNLEEKMEQQNPSNHLMLRNHL